MEKSNLSKNFIGKFGFLLFEKNGLQENVRPQKLYSLKENRISKEKAIFLIEYWAKTLYNNIYILSVGVI